MEIREEYTGGTITMSSERTGVVRGLCSLTRKCRRAQPVLLLQASEPCSPKAAVPAAHADPAAALVNGRLQAASTCRAAGWSRRAQLCPPGAASPTCRLAACGKLPRNRRRAPRSRELVCYTFHRLRVLGGALDAR